MALAAEEILVSEGSTLPEAQPEEVAFKANWMTCIGAGLFIGDLLMRGLTDNKDIFGLPYSLGTSAPRSIAIGAVAAGIVWTVERFGNNETVIVDPYQRSE